MSIKRLIENLPCGSVYFVHVVVSFVCAKANCVAISTKTTVGMTNVMITFSTFECSQQLEYLKCTSSIPAFELCTRMLFSV